MKIKSLFGACATGIAEFACGDGLALIAPKGADYSREKRAFCVGDQLITGTLEMGIIDYKLSIGGIPVTSLNVGQLANASVFPALKSGTISSIPTGKPSPWTMRPLRVIPDP